jgi:hypothetical protein
MSELEFGVEYPEPKTTEIFDDLFPQIDKFERDAIANSRFEDLPEFEVHTPRAFEMPKDDPTTNVLRIMNRGVNPSEVLAYIKRMPAEKQAQLDIPRIKADLGILGVLKVDSSLEENIEQIRATIEKRPTIRAIIASPKVVADFTHTAGIRIFAGRPVVDDFEVTEQDVSELVARCQADAKVVGQEFIFQASGDCAKDFRRIMLGDFRTQRVSQNRADYVMHERDYSNEAPKTATSADKTKFMLGMMARGANLSEIVEEVQNRYADVALSDEHKKFIAKHLGGLGHLYQYRGHFASCEDMRDLAARMTVPVMIDSKASCAHQANGVCRVSNLSVVDSIDNEGFLEAVFHRMLAKSLGQARARIIATEMTQSRVASRSNLEEALKNFWALVG